MKTSNKIFFGTIGLILLCVLTFMVTLRATMVQKEIINGNENMNNKEIPLTDYQHLSFGDNFEVELIKGAPSLKITAEENILEHIKVVQDKDGLRIEHDNTYHLRTTRRPLLQISLPTFESIAIDGSVDIYSDSTFIFEKLSIAITGSGNVRLDNITAKTVETSLNGAADIELSGTTNFVSYSCYGSGNFFAKNLVAENGKVEIYGAGDAEVHTNTQINAKIFGAGNIRYKGDPSNVDRYIGGAGNIEAF